MGQHKTPTQSETSLFHTRGQKMEPTRPADSWVSHLFDHSCGKEMSPLFRWSFINCPRLFSAGGCCAGV